MRALIVSLVLSLSAAPTSADTQLRAQANFPNTVQPAEALTMIKRQSGVLRYFFIDVYSAALFTPQGVEPSELNPATDSFRLETLYHRDIDREDALDLAWKVLRRQNSAEELDRLAAGIEALHAQIPDIRIGDRYSLTLRAAAMLELRRNGDVVFASDDPELARAYGNLWLGDDGISRKLRRLLLAAD